MSSKWLSLEEALAKALDAAYAIDDVEQVSIFEANNRILAHDLVATLDVPPWDNSAMDGYAVNVEDLSGSNELEVQGIITAGMEADTPLQKGKAFKIMTGAPIPNNANAVVMVENTSECNGNVEIDKRPIAHENIRKKANDIGCGDTLVHKGTRLRAEHLMLLSSQGKSKIDVFRKLRVGVVATGSELAAPGESRAATQIFESNRVGIASILQNENVELIDFGIVEDNEVSLRELFIEASKRVDVMVSSGGVSVGDADYVKDIIAELGSIDFWKVAVKPGKPFALGKINNTLFCGLPGNPVSSFVTAKLLVVPVIKKMQGEAKPHEPLFINATITTPLKRRAGRRDFQRATMAKNVQSEWEVTPFKSQSSGVMTSITSANCLMIVPEEVSELKEGDTVQVMPLHF
ncbi:gephyrin-like molybdotransferase Glp [Alteromonas mediterranea]|uniref:molybdopterin molybdotransferase MoeA n=1 Tax=Alteromonas mediterranea TaxID=314275 RepID=UPI00035563EF|nr:gephyrin-like molybdotransferase Glp [Alteromonas mediterranea]AGP85922.1 molybdopterin biosynthesis protein MoeA [Alteromonas mediterranea U4]AGP90054.1 molybdopterin biosynthesis protein MoeA [Alteromonas mediterranea U7]AGP93880.1 molybdopterin biosynthesis protein MoeA [Alteromonas mediterranea U8]|tara:strand:- start:3606 stop:4820 length:1215 start_codon:yes stop_codon:yes gene_type:complete